MAKAVSLTVELVNWETSGSVDSFHIAMWAFASKCLPIELVPCCDGWRRTWSQTIHMMPGLPVSSIPQCKLNCHEDGCFELFHAIDLFKPTFIEALEPSKRICKVRSLKSWIKTCSFLEEIITLRSEVFNDFESDMTVAIGKLGHRTWRTAESNDTVQHTAGFEILTLQPEPEKSER